ncbi:mucin-binding protein [Lactobacillus paragasseri]|uniref:mucin-binding protein n=1 Tax=Lactobacillus paragasseri TaxID=2107999 RepID=UPI003FA5C0E2
MAENTSDSKKVASNRDVNVIKNDDTTDEKAATKSSVQADKDVNANKLDTNTVSVNKLQRNFNVAGLTESKAASVANSATSVKDSMQQKVTNLKSEAGVQNIRGDVVARTVILNKPSGQETINQKVRFKASVSSSNKFNINGKTGIAYTAQIIAAGSDIDLKKYKVTVDSDTGEILSGQDLYDTLMNLQPSDFKVNLDAIDQSQIAVPGYSWKITSATPAGTDLGAETYTFGNPQTITIDYTRDVEGNVTKKVTEIIDKLVNNQMTTEPARTVILKKPTGTETIVQKTDIRGLARTSSKTVAGITEKKIEVAIAPYVEPDKPSSQYYKQYTITFNPDTGQIISGQNDYDQLMALKRSDFKAELPAINQSQIDVSGYTWKITSATPAGANLEAETYTFGHPQTITIDYTKEVKHTVTYQFKDPFGNQVGSSVPVTGATGSNQPVSLTLPAGYQLVSGSLPTSVTIPTNSDKTISLPVKYQLTITLLGDNTINYAGPNWQSIAKNKDNVSASGYRVKFNDDEAGVQLTNGDLTYDGNGNIGTYHVSLTEKGLNDIKEQLGDNFIYPDFKDVTNKATLTIDKGNKEIELNGLDTKVFDNTSTLPDQDTFYSGLSLGNDDVGRISIYKHDGTITTIQLAPNDVEFWLNGQKVAKDQAKNVGEYDLRLTDDFINKVKSADGNNGNNYEWTYGTHTPSGDTTYTAIYKIYQATGKAKLSGNNSKLYDGNAVTTADVNKDGKITIDLTLPVYNPDNESQLLRTVPLGKYTLQDGDYTWANGTAPTKGGSYTINLNKDKILDHLKARLVDLAGMGTDPDDSTKSLSNVTISADDMDGHATFAIETTTAYQFVDDDDNGSKVGTPVSKTGLKGESSNISLTVPTNYVLAAGQTLPTNVTFGDTNTTVDIHLKHATKTVDKNNVPDGYTKDDFAKTINRTITAKEPTGDVDLSQTTELTRTGTYDEVTKKVISYGNWTTGSFDEVTAPEVPGYTPSQAKVEGVRVTADSDFAPVTITYTANRHTLNINYVDKDGNKIGNSYQIPGRTDETVAVDVPGHVPANWELVPNQKYTTSITFGSDDPQDQNYVIQHKTTTTDGRDHKDNQDLYREVTRTILMKVPNATSQGRETETLSFYRIKTHDEVTGKDTYSDWTSNVTDNTTVFDEFDVSKTNDGKEIAAGYTPTSNDVVLEDKNGDKFVPSQSALKNGVPADSFTVEVAYTPNAQKTTVTYVDKDGKEITNPDGSVIPGSHYDLTGVTDQSNVPTNIQNNVPTNWHITDPDVPATITFGADGHTPITVHVAHNTKPADKDNVPDGYKKEDFDKTVIRTITAKEPSGDVDLSQHVELTRTGTYDEVTKKVVSYSDWTTDKFAEVSAPNVPGYTPSQAKVDGADVTVDSKFDPTVITYAPNAQKTTVTYVDKNGKEITNPDGSAITGSHYDVDGVTGQKDIPTNIEKNVPTNWHITDKTIPGTISFGPNGHDPITVHVAHNTKTVDKDNVPDGYAKDDFAKDISRSITAKEPSGDVDLSQKTELTRTGTYDEVTKKVVSYSDWTTDKFAEVSAPNVPGYTPSQAKVDGADVTVDSKFDPTVITYAPNAQKTTVTYVDKNGKEITNPDGSVIPGSHYDLTGVTDQSNVPTNIQNNVPTNWHITDPDVPATITFGADGHTPITVHVAHNTKTVDKDNVPDGYKREDFDKTVTRTITAKEPSGDVDLSQHVELTRTGTYDEVTKEVTYNPWTTSSFVEVTAPEVAGYTPSKASVEAVDKVTSDYVDPKVVINYVPNDQKGKISYVDDKTNTEIGTTSLTGKTDEDVVINPVAPAGWKIVDGQNIPKTEKATPNGIDTVIVEVEHKTTTVPPTDPKTPEDKLPDNPDKHYPDGVSEKDLNKTIVRQITVVRPDGTRESHDQSVKLTRTATVDEVTGEVTKYSDWTTGNFDEYDAPVIAGYTPSQAKVDGVKVTADSNFDPVVITYVEDPIGQDITVKKGDTPSPEDDVKNHGDLDKVTDPKHPDAKTTYTWKKTPDTSVPGNVPATVIVHYPDGSNKPVDITVHVIDETPIPTKDPDPIGQDITVKKGDTPSPEDGVKNHGDLDKVTDPKHPDAKTTYTWKKTPDTSVAGDVPATVIVHYPDGSNKPVDITIHVVDDTPVVPTKNPDPIGQDITVKKGDTPDPEDGVKNHGDLDKIIDPKHPGTKTTYTWKKTPDTSVAGDVPATVVVHYPDGSNKPVDITVHVVDDTPVVPTKNPDPVGQDITVKKGDTPDPEDGVKNHGDLDKITDPKHPGTKTTYTWKKTPDTSVAGDVPATVVVHYPDGSEKTVDITVHVVDNTPVVPTKNPEPTGQDIHTPQGKVPTPESAITNKDKMPDGTKYTWKEIPDVNTLGKHPSVVVVTYPDGTAVEVKVNVFVDGTPEAKKETKAPVVKKQVVEPTKVETRQKLVNNYVAPRAVEVQRAQAKGKRQLPQTGAKENIASEVLGMLSVGLGALTAGFASKRRKKNR